MSQILNPAIESSAVSSVTGTNGVSASPTTGAVVVSGVNATTSTVGVAYFDPVDFTVAGDGEVSLIASPTLSYVINTPIITGIDFTVVQTIPLFTPTIDFIVQLIYLIFDTVVSSNSDAVFNLGFNSPTFDNLIIGQGIGLPIQGGYVYSPPTNTLFLPSGQTATLNITTGDSGTTVQGRAFLIGSYL